MAKTYYLCNSCGYKSPKWLGKCPQCEEWGTFDDQVETRETKKTAKRSRGSSLNKKNLLEIAQVEVEGEFRYHTAFEEFDRLLGGGLVRGAVTLVTGNPGIGKSTLLLQTASEYASNYGKVVYVLGEESPAQVKNRCQRLNIQNNQLFLFQEVCIEEIYDTIILEKPKVVIIDSIQTVYSQNSDSLPGTPTQIRETTLKIIELAKTHNIAFFIVGHITKDGKVAGPKLLEHMVDTVLQFEGEEGVDYRILRSLKNRFGPTNELVIFNMGNDGMTEIKNAGEFFLSERDEKNIGSVIVPVLEGTRVFLLEVQTLTTDSHFGIPKRVVQGFDRNRVQIILALAEKKLGLNLGLKDFFVNIPGGITIKDPSADLSLIISLLSVVKGVEISQKLAALGELGLRGEIRKVTSIDSRLKELEKLGFAGVYVPLTNKKEIEKNQYKLKLIYLKDLDDLAERMR